MSVDFVTNQEIIVEARRKLSQEVWDYLTGGSESETTMRRNRLGFDSLAFRPRVLVDVSRIDPSTTFLGHKLRIPVMTAPIGSLQAITPGGGATVAKAVERFGTLCFISSVTQPSLQEIASASKAVKIYQLYLRGDLGWVEGVLEQVRQAGYVALCLTLDTAHYSRRERQLMNRWLPPSKRVESNRQYQAALTWETMAAIKKIAGMPLILKGIATAEDARIALDHGVEVLYVSNHGGRQLDHGRATIDVLPEIVGVAKGRAEIVLDGGVLRGTDVLKAIALGANAVTIGKLQGWGLAAAGEEGLVRVLELLEEEIVVAMGLLGVTSVDQLNPNYVCAAPPVALPHEMSAFPHLPGGRLI
ncbi:MAG TPA: alpha-hydroxy acid oxidase [candidate division Zixibacteria bacterium]|nr:alpha-hydroxy acid oxidase [candidate division Zixibacteria bacterium]